MTVDENFARVILRNPRKMIGDKNHTWDKMRFFKISHFLVTYKKNHSKMTPLTSLVIGSNLSLSLTDHTKKDSKMTRWRIFHRKITQNSQKNKLKRSLYGYEIEHYPLSL